MTAISRRGVLLAGALASAGLAGCGPEPRAAGAGSPSAGRASGATSPRTSLGVALVGCGGHGRALAERLVADDRVRVAAACDPDHSRAAELSGLVEQAGVRRPTALADLRWALDLDEVDAVVVATPNHWHALAAVWALEAGKDVYLEKPATHSRGEGQALLDAWAASGRVVEVGTQRRSHPGLQEAVAAVRAGEIGAVDHARCYSWKRRPSIGAPVRGDWPGTLDAELWYGPRPVVRPTRRRFHYDWHWFVDYGNGGLGNNGVHRLDVARWGMELPEQPDHVLSLGERLGPADAGQTPNTALTVVAYSTRTVAHDLRGLPTRPDARLDPGMRASDEVVFVGDGASVVVSSREGRLVDDSGAVVRRFGAAARDADPIARHLRGWVSACLAGDPRAVAVGPREGVAAATMCHAPAAADRWAREEGRTAGSAEVRSDVASLCGAAMDRPVASFLAHAGDPRSMACTGVRAVDDDAAHEAFEYRPGFQIA